MSLRIKKTDDFEARLEKVLLSCIRLTEHRQPITKRAVEADVGMAECFVRKYMQRLHELGFLGAHMGPSGKYITDYYVKKRIDGSKYRRGQKPIQKFDPASGKQRTGGMTMPGY